MAQGKGLTVWMVFKAIDRATKPLQRIGAAVQRVGRQTGLDVVGRRLGRLRADVGQAGRQFTQFATRAGAVAGVLGGAGFGLTGNFAKFADDVLKTSRRLGLTTDELQRFRYAAKLSGVSTQTFDMAMQRFGRRMGEAANGTGEAAGIVEELGQKFGFSLHDMEGNMRPVGDVFLEMVDYLKLIEDPMKRNAIAMKLFDSEGVALVQMMERGSPGIKAFGDELANAGWVFPREALEQGEEYQDSFTRMKESVTNLGRTIGLELLPMMQRIVEKITEWSQKAKPEIVEQVKKAFADLGAVLDWIGNAFDRIGRAVGSFLDWLETTHPAVAEWIGRLRDGAEEMGAFRLAVAGIATWLGAKFVFAVGKSFVSMLLLIASMGAAVVRTGIFAGALVFKGILALFGFAGALWGAARAAGAFALALLANPITWIALGIAAAVAGIGYAAYLIYEHWRDIPAFFAGVWRDIKNWFLTPFGKWDEAIARALTDAWHAVVAWATGVPEWFAWAWGEITAAFDIAGWVSWLERWSLWPAMTGWASGVSAWFTALWQRITAAFDVGSWLEGLRTWSLFPVLSGWASGVSAWFTALWQRITAAFDVGSWLEGLRTWSLFPVLSGWASGVSAWFTALWQRITAAFDVGSWLDELRTWSLFPVLSGWASGVSAWFTALWQRITAAFDVGSWLDELRTWSLLPVVTGWASGASAWFTALWQRITAAFDVGSWLDELRTWSLLPVVTGWASGVSAWFTALWQRITAAFDVGSWLEDLRGWSLTATVKGWFVGALTWVAGWWRDFRAQIGIDALISALSPRSLYATITGWFDGTLAWVQGFWGDIRHAIGIDRLVSWLDTWTWDVSSTIKGWFAGVVAWVKSTWADVRRAIGIEALIEWLESFSLWHVAVAWIDGLWAGVMAGWKDFVAWFHGAIDDALAPFLWALRAVGILDDEEGGGATGTVSTEGVPRRVLSMHQPAANTNVPFGAPAVPSAIGPGSEVLQGGAPLGDLAREVARVLIQVDFTNVPQGTRFRQHTRGDVDLELNAGYAMESG